MALTPIAFHKWFFFFFIYNLLTLLPNYKMQAPPCPTEETNNTKAKRLSHRVCLNIAYFAEIKKIIVESAVDKGKS